jgi:hypothetical protein
LNRSPSTIAKSLIVRGDIQNGAVGAGVRGARLLAIFSFYPEPHNAKQFFIPQPLRGSNNRV